MSFVSKYIDKRIGTVLEGMNLKISSNEVILSDERYTELQNKVLYLSDSSELLRWFKINRPKNMIFSTEYFYRVVSGKIPFMHYPLANIITKSMVNLLFSDSPRIESISGNKETDKNINKLIDDLYESNSKGNIFQRACELESYSGCVAFKIVLDNEFSDFPIIISYPKEDIEVIKKYGRAISVTFKDEYVSNNTSYFLYTICGIGYIDYKLYTNINKNNVDLNEVPLSSLDETADLHRINFFYPDGMPFNKLTCIYKENKNNAQSDYYNLLDDFAALDEIYTNEIDFIRKSRVKTYLPETMLEENINTGEKFERNEYDSSNVILKDSNPEGTTQEIKRDIPSINNSIQGYKDAFNNILLNALSTAGLSPCTIGLDMSGANSSALALNIRERVSLRTRAEKQKRWRESIIELTKLLLSFYSINSMENGDVVISYYDKDIKVEFPEYDSPTFSEQVTSLGEALDNKLIDLESALKLLYPEKGEEEILLMKEKIDKNNKEPVTQVTSETSSIIPKKVEENKQEENN